MIICVDGWERYSGRVARESERLGTRPHGPTADASRSKRPSTRRKSLEPGEAALRSPAFLVAGEIGLAAAAGPGLGLFMKAGRRVRSSDRAELPTHGCPLGGRGSVPGRRTGLRPRCAAAGAARSVP